LCLNRWKIVLDDSREVTAEFILHLLGSFPVKELVLLSLQRARTTLHPIRMSFVVSPNACDLHVIVYSHDVDCESDSTCVKQKVSRNQITYLCVCSNSG
jgi:hypothetical protein